MKKLLEVALGVVTSVGGFLEIGSVVTAAQAGALFGTQLLWAVVLGSLCAALLVEMAGRLAAVSKHTLRGAIREELGYTYSLVTLAVGVLVDLMVLASEIGGVSLALELATGVSHRIWAVPVAAGAWLLLWRGTFGLIENGVAVLGLVTLSFVVAAARTHPHAGALAASLLPTLPHHDRAQYWFGAVSILGASITPYLFFFYSSGAIEERWTETDLPLNRMVAGLGMGFGCIIAVGVLVAAAGILHPAGVRVEHFQQLPALLTTTIPRWGLVLFICSMGIACLGATLEVGLSLGYEVAQSFGWRWGENARPHEAPRFALTYTAGLLLAVVPIVVGVDPVQLTVVSMTFAAISLPLVVAPFIVVMNERRYLRGRTNHRAANIVVAAIGVLAVVLALAAIPLQLLGGG